MSSWELRFPSIRSCCAFRVESRCTLFACLTLVMREERLRSQEGVKYLHKVSRVEGSGKLRSSEKRKIATRVPLLKVPWTRYLEPKWHAL